MNNVKAIQRITETELVQGSGKKSWHDMYSDSAYVFIGGLDYGLTEGDVLAVFSQYGEIMNINLVRDKKTGKSKGFCFLCYENQKSTVLAVDNFNGIKLCGRTIRVDHVTEYRRPKDEQGNEIIEKGCAPKTPTPSPEPSESEPEEEPKAKKKKVKIKSKDKKKRKKEKQQRSVSPNNVERTKKQHSRGHKEHMGSPEDSRRAFTIDRDRSRDRRGRDEETNDRMERQSVQRRREKGSYRERSRSRSRDKRDHHR